MEKVSILRRYGLFDAKVPRYTSYPPANRFLPDVGRRRQVEWLDALPKDDPVSVYVHIPFCRRLCWFCACRTQGTKTLAPVDGYMDDVIAEIEAVSARLPDDLPMARLHLGGGTPTLLPPPLMARLLDALDRAFPKAGNFEFSVEIDPTEASSDILDHLAQAGMNRASIGVQDFHPAVQKAIGREQSFADTRVVTERLRADGVESLNIDILYGLPHQTEGSLMETLDQVASLGPDRVALYGYAHVPHVSKRQVMIPTDSLPDAETRFRMSELAQSRLSAMGFVPLGIDHFARPEDSLAKSAEAGTMHRNFQGYTDDPCATLLGFGASAISRFPMGYAQNAVSTAAYRERVRDRGLAAHKGYAMSEDDGFVADLIDGVMCDGRISLQHVGLHHPNRMAEVARLTRDLIRHFPDLMDIDEDGIAIRKGYWAAARLIAAHLDQSLQSDHIHSLAV